jgi:hypothetical protein
MLKPTRKWDGKDKSFKFIIRGVSDSEFCKDDDRKSVGGHSVYLEDCLVAIACRTQRIVALSVTEAELIQVVECVQDMMFVWRLFRSMELQVQLPMLLETDNSGAMDIVNNWSSSGRTRHIDCRYKMIRELKEAGILEIRWRRGEDNETDALTKNLNGRDFERHTSTWVTDRDVNPT